MTGGPRKDGRREERGGDVSTGVRVVGAADEDGAVPEDEPEAPVPGAVTSAAPATGETVPEEATSPGGGAEEAMPPIGRRPVRGRKSPTPAALRTRRRRRAFAAVAVVAVLGVAGTVGFGVAWAGQRNQAGGEAQARTSAKTFLVALTNFDAKTVDADFSAITTMATGTFAGQATKFFNSSIRQQLENALASSRGQIRSLYVQTYRGTQASVYAVVDQLYVNNKISSPQSDVLRIVVNLTQVGGTWKVSDVTVLTGPSLGSTSSSGSSTTTTAPAG